MSSQGDKEIDALAKDYYRDIRRVLRECNWIIDAKELDNDILHINRDGKYYILHIFLGNGECDAWSSNEDDILSDTPTWFAKGGYRTSPIYKISNYVSSLKNDGTNYTPIVVLLPPVYLQNAKDCVGSWGSIAVCSFNTLKNAISPGGSSQLNIKTDILDISTPQVIEAPDKIKRVEFGILRPEIPDDPKPSSATYFKPFDGGAIIVWAELTSDIASGDTYIAELRDSDNNIISTDRAIFSSQRSIFALEATFEEESSCWVYIYYRGLRVYSQEINIVDIQGVYSNNISIEQFLLCRMDSNDADTSYQELYNKGSQSCFKIDDLLGILSIAIFKNILTTPLKYQFIIKVYNEVGKNIYENENHGVLEPNAVYIFTSEIINTIIQKGNYKLNIEFYDEIVISTTFVVGERDIKTSSTPNQLQHPQSSNNLNETASTQQKGALEQLESMIGLTSIKQEVKKNIALIKMAQHRAAKGLPVEPHQLHMAFLGNPGTGKTTVAKLLGAIYKEIGVLSKGHVVLEERSTLMNQNWGGEGDLVNKAIDASKGGILFIDEAYDLVTESKNDPGKLIISALLSAMANEDNRDWMVILAGYTQPMERLMTINPGLKSRLTPLYFKDYNAPELMQIADMWLDKNCFTLMPDARKHLEFIVGTAYQSRDENFGNGRFIKNLLEREIQPAMAERVMAADNYNSIEALTTIEACDIPNYNVASGAEEAISKLNSMIGLSDLKQQISTHLSYIRFVQARRDNKIDTTIPPLHMIFTGNPGTGKSSVAEYLGDIYRSIGVLSVGNVIKVTRADMIDDHVGGTEKKMKNLLTAARGNILFIDEAYTLFSKGDNDYGKIAVEALLDKLGREMCDMIVIMAGYSKEMDELLNSNPGLKGRFPYKFNFEDYREEELYAISETVANRHNIELTPAAQSAIKALIRREYRAKDSNFSNARFVVRLITTQIIPNMARRLEGETSAEKLRMVELQDIPINPHEVEMINENLFDEEGIKTALCKLNNMVGLTKVKEAIHQFVDFTRAHNSKDPHYIDNYPLKWSFVGNTGTGKSSVAELLSEILKAMHILASGHTVEIKAEDLYGVATHKADQLLQERMRESQQGLLFVDGDAPQFRASESKYNPDYLRVSLATNTNEIRGRFAVVIAEHDTPRIGLAKSLNKIGINNFDQTLIFDDYTSTELKEILEQKLAQYNLTLHPDALTIMQNYINQLCSDRKSGYANARTMQLLAKTIHNIVSVSTQQTTQITAAQVENFKTIQPPTPQRKKVGFC